MAKDKCAGYQGQDEIKSKIEKLKLEIAELEHDDRKGEIKERRNQLEDVIMAVLGS